MRATEKAEATKKRRKELQGKAGAKVRCSSCRKEQAQGGGAGVRRTNFYASLVDRAANDSDGVLM